MTQQNAQPERCSICGEWWPWDDDICSRCFYATEGMDEAEKVEHVALWRASSHD